jgi:hypothetical protein
MGAMRVAVFAAVVFVGLPASAMAEEIAPGVALAVDARAGLEGGGSGYAAGVRRSRTTLRFGAEAWLFEDADDRLAIGLLAEVEPRLGFGGDFHYQRRLVDWLLVEVGPSAIFAPNVLLGGGLGLSFRPRLDDDIELAVGPLGQLYAGGSDLPDRVLGQFLINAGMRFGL